MRECGILSTCLYEVYIDELLRILQSKGLGLHIGTVYIGCPTCANEVALLALSPDELQIMLYEAFNYSQKHRYQIPPIETSVVAISIYKLNEDLKWTLGENVINRFERSVHIGITRAGKKETSLNEPPHDKTNEVACAPSEDSDQLGHPPSLIRVFAVRMKKAWVRSYPLSAQ